MSRHAETRLEAGTPAAADVGTVEAAPAPIRLGPWNFYFIAKLALFWNDLIGFHPLENVAFAAFVLVPVESPLWRRIRAAAAVPLAIALLYYDSWLPPVGRVWSQASLLSDFSFSYLVELAGRFVSLPVVTMLVIAWAAYRLISRWVRVGVLVMGALIALSVTPTQVRVVSPGAGAATGQQSGDGNAAGGEDGGPARALRDFFGKEARRAVSLPGPEQLSGPPFDVIIVHVCSLSWDDLGAVGLDRHSLWRRFDIVLTRFNSASSYSGPAAVRMLRASCGQTPHAELYAPGQGRCYLMANLERSGYRPDLVLNHDGHFDDFLHLVRTQGNLKTPPMALNGIPVAQRSFDDSPIYDDFAVLSRWWETRQKMEAPRAAVYYNTTSLHDGNRTAGSGAAYDSLETYKIRLAKFLDDLDAFMQKIEDSGRRAVVVMVPEHGAAIRGEKMQIAGLREIPSPAITLVPVGIKVLGATIRREGDPVRIDTPTSYLAVTHVVARMLEKSPYATDRFVPADYVGDLPATDLVSENEGMVVVEQGGRYHLRQDGEGWIEYAPGPQVKRGG